MGGNPYNSIRIKSLRTSMDELRHVKSRLTDQEYDMILLRDFIDSGLDPSSLPTDDPDTPNKDESVSEDEIHRSAENTFNKPWGQIYDEFKDDPLGFKEQYYDQIMAKVREIIGKQYSVESEIDDIKSEIDDITNIEKSTGAITT